MTNSVLTPEKLAILHVLRLHPGYCAAEVAPIVGRFVPVVGDELRLLRLDGLVSHTGYGWVLTEQGRKVVCGEATHG